MSDMKPFVVHSALVNPLDIARRDHMDYSIGKILDHRDNIKKKITLEFHGSCRLKGGSASNDPGGPRSIFPICGYLNLQELSDLSSPLPQTLRMPYSLLE